MASHETKMEKGVIQGELRRQLSVVNLLPARQAAPVWRGRQVKEQEAGVESEGGGEDEGGEGDAVGDQDDREISTTTWEDNSELNPRGIREEL